ncbi:hypothetical protein GGI02_003131 [Coemansia sp. RSA 2322]|nr:hypothetical protein GGI02_003131 [Coemansia sp. RSA 2322]
MDSAAALPEFDELPLVYQARIRDVQQEYMDGDITQKGYDKRMAKIVQDYQSSTTAVPDVSDVLEAPGGVYNARPSHEQFEHASPTSGSNADLALESELLAAPAQPRSDVGPRGGASTQAFYDARKSTFVGFRKPGINFDALLDDFDDGDIDLQALSKSNSSGPSAGEAGDGAGRGDHASNGLSKFGYGAGLPLQPAPPVPELPGDVRGSYSTAPSAAARGAGYGDDELSSGRAYNVLSDIMDPYGSQLLRTNQELYSDDSSNDEILDDLDGLSPAGISSGYSKQPVSHFAPGSTSEANAMPAEASPEFVAAGVIPCPNGEHANDSGHQAHVGDSRSSGPATGAFLNRVEVAGSHRPGAQTPASRPGGSLRVGGHGLNVYEPSPGVNMLTPDTPTVGQFGAGQFGAGSTFTDTIRAPRKPAKAFYSDAATNLSPISGAIYAERDHTSSGEGTPSGQGRSAGLHSVSSSATDNAATITSGVGTITLDDMAQAAVDSSARPDYASPHDARQANGSMLAATGRATPINSHGRAQGNRTALPSAWVSASTEPAPAIQPLAPATTELGSSQGVAGPSNKALELEPGFDGPTHTSSRSSSQLDNGSPRSSLSYVQRPSIQSVAFGSFGDDTPNMAEGCYHENLPELQGSRHLRMIDSPDTASADHQEIAYGELSTGLQGAAGLGNAQGISFNAMSMSPSSPNPPSTLPQPSQPSINVRSVRRPTFSTRSDRRPTTSTVGGVGRASYYAPESQPEIPANFDLHIPNIDSAMVAALESAADSADVDAPPPADEDTRDSIADYAFEHPLPYHSHSHEQSHGHGSGPSSLNPVITNSRVLASNQAAQYAFEQSGASRGGGGSAQLSMTAPLERSLSGEVAGDFAPNSAPLADSYIHSVSRAQGGYTHDNQPIYEDWSAGMQYDADIDPRQQQQQPPTQQQHMESPLMSHTASVGAIVYPREIPDDVHSNKLKSIMSAHENLPSVLRYRASATPSEIAYTCIDTKGKEIGSWTWAGLHTRAVQVVQLLRQNGVSVWGDRVALVYRKYEMLDFVGSLFGCFYAGLCAVPIVAGDSYAELVHVLQSTSSALVLTTELNIKALNKDISQHNVGPGWPTDVAWVRTDNLGGCVLSPVGAQNPSSQYHSRSAVDGSLNSRVELRIDDIGPDDLAYIEFSKSPNGELKGVQISHGAIMRQSAVWMMSTGMLDIGRKYQHRVELEEHENALADDYSLGLADPSNELDDDSAPSTPQSTLDAMDMQGAHEYSGMAASSTTAEHDGLSARGSLGKKWGVTSGFLGRLRNVGSLPKMRRGSRARDSSIASHEGKPAISNGSARNSLIGHPLGSGRVRAASNLSTQMQQQQQSSQHQAQQVRSPQRGGSSSPHLPSPIQKSRTRLSAAGRADLSTGNDVGGGMATAATPSANVAVFKDVVVFYIEPRQHFGLVYGIFGGCYGGHQSIYASSALCDVPGAYINLLTRYKATVAVGDYTGLQSVLSTATDEPGQIIEYSKKVAPNLACLRLCLIDTLFIDAGFHATFDKNVLHPFGCPYQSIADTEGHPVMTAVCTLAEHGSILMAMRDCLSSHPPLNVDFEANGRYEFVLDRAGFKENRVVVLPDEKNEAEVDHIGTVRYQSFGFPALSATMAVVDPETRELCAADAIGELWINSSSLSSGFWGLPKLSSSIFAARFTYSSQENVELVSSSTYLRTGLMGAVVQGRVIVFGFYEDRIRTLTIEPGLGALPDTEAWFVEPTLGFHYAGDINSTIRRYLPQVTECTAFEMFANDTHFPVIAAEVRHNSGMYATIAEEIYGVLRKRHGLYAYAVALCPPNSLPRAFQYGKRTVNAQLCRHQFESGKVNCLYVKMSTDHLFMNLPPPAHSLPDDEAGGVVDPSVALYGRWQQQTSLEEGMASVDEMTGVDLLSFASITEILIWRAAKSPDLVAYTQFDERGRPLKPVSFAKLLAKVSAVAQLMLEKRRVAAGDHVLVAIAPSPSLAIAVHACLAIGAIPIPIAPPDIERLSDDMPPLLVTAREFRVNYILVDQLSEEIFRSKMMEAAMRVQSLQSLLGGCKMPVPLSLAKATKSPKHLLGQGSFRPSPQWADASHTALVMQFTGAQASTPQYVSYTHRAILGFCSQQKGDFQMVASLPVIASVRAYSGYGLLHCTMIGVYVGCMTLLLSPVDFFAAPYVWFELVQRYNVKDAFTTLPMLQHAMNFLSAYVGQYRFKLGAVRNFIVATEERVDPLTYAKVRDFFALYGLDETAINPLYGTLMNPCISTRAYLGVSPLTLRLDIHAMRRGKVVALPPLSEVDNPAEAELHSLTLQDSGKVSGSTMVAIVDPMARHALAAGCIGEVWVCSSSNASRKQTPVPGISSAGPAAAGRPLMTITDSTGYLDNNKDNVFVRTGDLGFLYLQVSQDSRDGAPAEPYLFVAGRIAETFNVGGYMYFYSDVERAVEEPCDDIVPGCCVVIQTSLQASKSSADGGPAALPGPASDSSALRLVAVISLRKSPSESFLPNAACLVFNNVLDRHQVLLDEIVFVPRDALPRSRISERRRRTVRGLYESGKLNAFVNYPIANSPTLTTGAANPNSRLSFLGPPATGSLLAYAQ